MKTSKKRDEFEKSWKLCELLTSKYVACGRIRKQLKSLLQGALLVRTARQPPGSQNLTIVTCRNLSSYVQSSTILLDIHSITRPAPSTY